MSTTAAPLCLGQKLLTTRTSLKVKRYAKTEIVFWVVRNPSRPALTECEASGANVFLESCATRVRSGQLLGDSKSLLPATSIGSRPQRIEDSVSCPPRNCHLRFVFSFFEVICVCLS